MRSAPSCRSRRRQASTLETTASSSAIVFSLSERAIDWLGGTWQRPSRADVDRYPVFKKRWLQQTSSQSRVSPNEGLPMALGDVRYKDPAAIEAECRDFKDVLALTPNVFAELFMNAPSPGIVAAADQESALRYAERLFAGARRSAAGRIRSHRAGRIRAADRRAGPRARTPHILQGQAALRIPRIRRSGYHRNQSCFAERGPYRVRLTSVGAIPKLPHDCDVPLEEILPIIRQAKVGGLVLPFAGSAPRA